MLQLLSRWEETWNGKGEVSSYFWAASLHRPLSLDPPWVFTDGPVSNLNRWLGNRQGFLAQVLIQYEKYTTVTHLETLPFPSGGCVDFNYLCMTDMKWEYSYGHTLHNWLQCPQSEKTAERILTSPEGLASLSIAGYISPWCLHNCNQASSQCGKQSVTQMVSIKPPCLLVCHAWGLGDNMADLHFSRVQAYLRALNIFLYTRFSGSLGVPILLWIYCLLSVKSRLGWD